MPKEPRKTITLRLKISTVERLRRVSAHAAGIPCFATTAGIVEAGINAECARIEAILRVAYKGVEEPAATPVRRVARIATLNNHCADESR